MRSKLTTTTGGKIICLLYRPFPLQGQLYNLTVTIKRQVAASLSYRIAPWGIHMITFSNTKKNTERWCKWSRLFQHYLSKAQEKKFLKQMVMDLVLFGVCLLPFCLFFKFILRKHDLAKLQNTRLQTTCTIFSECTKAALCPPMLLCGSTSIDV